MMTHRPAQSDDAGNAAIPSPSDMQPLALAPTGRAMQPLSSADKEPSGPQGPTSTDHAKFSEELHGYIREYIRNADQKATFFFATLTAMLAFLNSQNVPARWLKDIHQWSFVDGLAFVSTLSLAGGAVTLLTVVFPRMKGSRRGLLYFNAISEYESQGEYATDVLIRSGDDLVRLKLQHCHELSRICRAKYAVLRIGFWIGCVGAVTAMLFLVLAKSG